MKKKTVNKKKVVATISNVTICQSKSYFCVFDDNGKVGELQLTQGSITWIPRDAKRGRSIYWEEFDRLMQNYVGKNVKR